MSGAKSMLRRLLGLDRGEASKRPAPASKSGGDNPFVRSVPPRLPAADIEVSRARETFGSWAGRWGLRALLWVLVLAGVISIVRGFLPRDETGNPSSTATAGIDVGAAQAAAARTVTDYLSWSPESVGTLGRTLAVDGDVADGKLSGLSVLSPSDVIAGRVQRYSDTYATVVVDARVSAAVPRDAAASSAAASEATAGTDATETADETSASAPRATPTPRLSAPPAAPPPATPPGYRSAGSGWLQLAVPIHVDDAGTMTTDSPVLVKDPLPAEVAESQPAAKDSIIDSPVSSSTERWAQGFLKAYAAGDPSYQAAPGVTLRGLGGEVTLTSARGWALSEPRDDGSRIGVITAVWQLTGTDLVMAQRYRLTVVQEDGRWYVRDIGPAPGSLSDQ